MKIPSLLATIYQYFANFPLCQNCSLQNNLVTCTQESKPDRNLSSLVIVVQSWTLLEKGQSWKIILFLILKKTLNKKVCYEWQSIILGKTQSICWLRSLWPKVIDAFLIGSEKVKGKFHPFSKENTIRPELCSWLMLSEQLHPGHLSVNSQRVDDTDVLLKSDWATLPFCRTVAPL